MPAQRPRLAAGRPPEHVGHLSLSLTGTLSHLFALARDLGRKDLALALAAHVLAGGHAEDPRQARGDAGDQDLRPIAGGTREGAHHPQRADQTVLGPEDRLTDLSQGCLAPLVGEVLTDPGAVEVGRGGAWRWGLHARIVPEGGNERVRSGVPVP